MRLPIAVRLKLIACATAAIGAGLVGALAAVKRLPSAPPHLQLAPDRIWADGYDVATLTVEGPDGVPPRVSVTGAVHVVTVSEARRTGGKWEAQIRAGDIPGRVTLKVQFPAGPPASIDLTAGLSTLDGSGDGTPDFLRLDDLRDQRAFRRWFTFLAEAQYFQDPAARPAEIDDCAALIRYAYREALHAHDNAWTAQARLPLIPALPSPARYTYPYTAIGATLFRVKPGPFRESDLSSGAFSQFADVKSLWRFNSYLISRNLGRAQSGDLLFFRQDHDNRAPTFHSMIFLGESQIHPDGARYVVYHTGPQDAGPGEMRRLSLGELRRFPETEWRPEPENPRFLGVFRWNILKTSEIQN